MSSSSPGTIKVVCGWLNATLCVKDLSNGSSRCVHLGSPAEILTPCEFERRAGRGATKNWKKSIRFRDKPLSEFLESYTNSVGKKCFNFVAPGLRTCRVVHRRHLIRRQELIMMPILLHHLMQDQVPVPVI